MFAKLTPNQVPKRGLTDLFVRQLEFELNRSTNWDKKILLPSILEAKSITMSRCFHCYPSCFTQFGLFTVPPPSSTNFLEILVRAQAGDPTASSQLYDIFRPDLEQFCRRMVSGCNEGQDFAQETWIKVLKHFSSTDFDDKDHFEKWVFRIARNTFLDSIRRNKTVNRHDEFDITVSIEGRALDEMIRMEDGNRLKSCIERLSDEHKSVLLLQYFEFLKYHEIAEKLNLEKSTVGTRINRAKAILKDCMESKST